MGNFFPNGQGKPSVEGPCFVVVVLFCSFLFLFYKFLLLLLLLCFNLECCPLPRFATGESKVNVEYCLFQGILSIVLLFNV